MNQKECWNYEVKSNLALWLRPPLTNWGRFSGGIRSQDFFDAPVQISRHDLPPEAPVQAGRRGARSTPRKLGPQLLQIFGSQEVVNFDGRHFVAHLGFDF